MVQGKENNMRLSKKKKQAKKKHRKKKKGKKVASLRYRG